MKTRLLLTVLLLLSTSVQAQQTQSTINPNVPPVGFLVEQSGPQFRDNFQRAINDINYLFSHSGGGGGGLVVGTSPITGSCTIGFNLFNNAGILGCQANGTGVGLTVGNSTISGGTTQQLLYDNAGILGEITKGNNCLYGTSGTGIPSCQTTLPSGLTAPSLIVTGAFTATGLVTNADLVNAATTVNGQTCTLGAACTISASAGTITVGVTTIATGTTNQLLYDNGGLLGEVTKGNSCLYGTSGTGVPSCLTTLPSSLTAASFTVTGSFTATGLVTNADLVNASTTVNGQTCTLGGACTVAAAAGTLTGTTLAATVTASSLTSVGTLTGGATGAGFTVALTTSTITGLLPLANGGTNANLTASNGGVFYSTGSAGAILAGTATASLPLLSGATAAPTWATVSHPTSATSGGIPFFSSTTVMASSALLGANCVVTGGGAGVAPATSTSNCPTVSAAGAVVINNTLNMNRGGDTSGSLQLLSGAAGTFTLIGIGRTASEFALGVAGGASQFFTGTAAGDSVVYSPTGNQFLGTIGAATVVKITTSNVLAATFDASQGLTLVGLLTLPNLSTDTAATTTRTVCQNVTGTGTVNALYFGSGAAGICKGTSARFMKQDIEPIMYGLREVMQTSVHSFEWRPGFSHDGDLGRQQVGFMADEVAASMPLFATKDPQTGVAMSVDYMGAMLALFRSVQQIVETCDVVANDNFCIELKKKIARQ